MRKKLLFSLIVLSCTLTGCSAQEDFVNNVIQEAAMKEAGITNDKTYQQYLEMQEKGELTKDGLYNELEKQGYNEENQKNLKQVHITFATNCFLNIQYYYDAELKKQITEDSIYLNPGEKIYCSQPETKNEFTNSYIFSGFQIYEFMTNEKEKLFATTNEGSLVLDIPSNYKGTELSVIPIGTYEKRNLTFHAFYNDVNGVSKKVHGSWFVNDELHDISTEISSSDSYIVRFEYDGEQYYFVKSDPPEFSVKQEGIVEFGKSTALNTTEQYSVQLHHFITANFDTHKKISKITLNDEEIQPDDSKLKKLKASDKITVTTNDDYRIFCTNLKLDTPEQIEGGFRYTIVIPDSNEVEYNFKIAKSNLEVVLNESVGSDIKFNLMADGLNKSGYYKSSNSTLHKGSIGVENSIKISASEGELKNSSFLRFEIEKEDRNGKTILETLYLKKLPGSLDIGLYPDAENVSNLDKIYETVSVNISMVTGKLYTVTLDSNDLYGNVIYKLNDEKVEFNTGEKTKDIEVLDSDELTMEYELVEKGYHIVKESKWFGESIYNHFTSDTESKKINISEDTSKKIITREDYITIEKGE